MLITSVSETHAACWALRKNPLNPFNLCSDNITKWKLYDVPENWEFRERFFFMPIYAILRALLFFCFCAFFFYEKFQERISWSSWRFSWRSYEEILFREKRSESSKLFFSEHHLFLRDKTLPSLVIIENADLRDATEWGALNRKSRLLCFARICNLLRGGKNSLFIEIQ